MSSHHDIFHCGGWTEIIHDSNTNLTYLSHFGSTSNISSTFYNDTNYGIGWGANDNIAKVFSININYTKLIIQYTGFYNIPSGGLGILILSDNHNSFFTFNDSWSDDNTGQSLNINNTSIFDQYKMNVTNRKDTIIINNSTQLNISMAGYINSFPYTKRYIYNLKVR